MFDTITDKIRNAGVSINDKELYAQVANEIARGTLDPGLWTKAFADSRGDKKQAEVLYIRMRVADIAAQRKRLEYHRQKETIRTETYRQIEGLEAQQQMLESALSNLEAEYRRTPNGLGLALVFAAIFLRPGSKSENGAGIEFDVAVTMKTAGDGKAGAKVKLAVVEAELGGSGGASKESVSRIKFIVNVGQWVG